MISLHITELKNFMGKLLGSDCFDSFLLEEAVIETAATYTIDGHVNRDFYTNEEWETPSIRPYDFVTWSSIRPICFDMIKGKRTPSRFKIVLHLRPEYVAGVIQKAQKESGGDSEKKELSFTEKDVKALVATCRYDSSGLSLVTGTSFHTFVPDKTLERAWDKTMRQFLAKKEISFTE